MLFDGEGVLAGGVSAGCLEADLIKRGAWLTRQGPTIEIYDASDEDDTTTGHGCSGKISVLVESVDDEVRRCFQELEEELTRQQRVALVTIVDSDEPSLPPASHLFCSERGRLPSRTLAPFANHAVARDLLSQARCVLAEGNHRAHTLRCEGVEALVQVLEPPPHLFIFGAGRDAVPVVELAHLLGWHVSVCTPAHRPLLRDRFGSRLLEISGRDAAKLAERCARPLALVMAHDFATDRNNLEALLDSTVPYIGVVGPAHRTQRLLAELHERGHAYSRTDLERVRAPAGLRLGAETPAEIALSILSEAQALVSRTEVIALRDCVQSIHAPHLRLVPAWHAGGT